MVNKWQKKSNGQLIPAHSNSFVACTLLAIAPIFNQFFDDEDETSDTAGTKRGLFPYSSTEDDASLASATGRARKRSKRFGPRIPAHHIHELQTAPPFVKQCDDRIGWVGSAEAPYQQHTCGLNKMNQCGHNKIRTYIT